MNDAHDIHPAATPDFWSTRWRAGQIGFHRDTPNERLVSEFERAFGTARGRVLVPLCGKSVDLRWLGGHFEEVVGIEFVEQAALEFAAESGRPHRADTSSGLTRVTVDNVSVLVGDFFEVGPTELGRFDAAYDRAALIAIPPDRRRAYAAQLASLLTSGGRALIVTIDYPPDLMSGPPFAIHDDEVTAIFSAHGSIERLTHEPTREGPSRLPAGAPVTTSTFRFSRHTSRP